MRALRGKMRVMADDSEATLTHCEFVWGDPCAHLGERVESSLITAGCGVDRVISCVDCGRIVWSSADCRVAQ